MDLNSGFGEILETGRSSVRKAAKTTGQGASNFTKTAQQQVIGQSWNTQQGTNEQAALAGKQMSDDDAKKFLQDLYGAKASNQQSPQGSSSAQTLPNKPQATNVKTALGLSDTSGVKAPTPQETIKTAIGIPQSEPQKTNTPQNQSTVSAAIGIPQKDPNEGKTPEEIAKIEALRQQLHKDYYESLTNRKKPEEEHVTEKLEREEEKKKLSELEEEKKKPPPLPATVKQGTGEKVVGVSG
ncbi:MAG: hypothetical protein HYW63_04000 [Candidatus Levybacteria bacterium]|nr:hypothetical protein [Candidatus Levybacteria bacterium]